MTVGGVFQKIACWAAKAPRNQLGMTKEGQPYGPGGEVPVAKPVDKFYPWDRDGSRRKLTPSSCPLTFGNKIITNSRDQ